MKKRILSILLSVSLLFGTVAAGAETVTAAPAQQTSNVEREYPTGYLPLEVKELSQEAVSEDSYFEFPENMEKTLDKKSAVYNHSWDQYGNYYFYNKMTESERSLYDKLDTICCYYLEMEESAVSMMYDGKEEYLTGVVSTDGLTREEAIRVLNIFYHSSPQYYFLSNVSWYTADAVGMGIYKAFADGSERKAATAEVQNQLDTWSREIAGGATDYDKARIAHDLINKKVIYNDDFYTDQNFDEETAFSQTAYSVFCMDKTVCAGYSHAFQMLCNGAGIDTVAVTSEDHEWNKIRLNDSWYNVDCTWDDDPSGKVNYSFFACSDDILDKGDTSAGQQGSHTEESMWEGMLPVCSLDSGSTDTAPGTLPEITAKTATPVILCDKNTGAVTLSCETENADIYYSLDGTVPSPSSVKCRLYNGKAVSAGSSYPIQAVAVADAHLDSDTNENMLWMIQFYGNGATSGSMQALRYDGLQQTALPANAYKRTGYTFAGWNTKADGTGNSYSNQQILEKGSEGNLTLYAQWVPNRYAIAFHGNKKTSGTMSTLTQRQYGVGYRLPQNSFKRKGYTFTGWNTKVNGTGKKYANRQTVKNLTAQAGGKVTLYAQWKKTKYKVKYSLQGGKNNKKNPSYYYYTSKTVKLKNATRRGYIFKGWYADKKYKKRVTAIKKGSTGNKTLYAKWKKKK